MKKTILALFLMAVMGQTALAMVSEVMIEGKVISYDKKSVVVLTNNRKVRYNINLIKDRKQLKVGETITFALPVNSPSKNK